MEGVIQYRLLGDHPAASGRYLTLGFPGETTTRDKVVEQLIQEHRINTSRYKLEVRKLVAARDAAGGKHTSSLSSPPPAGGINAAGNGTNNAGSSEDSNLTGTLPRDAVVPVVLHENADLHTYDRLTITVSQRQLADDDATRKEQAQLERQRRVRETEEELLATTNAVLPPLAAQDEGTPSNSATPSPPPSSILGQAQDSSSRLPGRGVAASVDPLRLQRAAALASQLFPIMKGQHSTLSGIDDSANTHQCVLCRLPAFEEQLTSCCRFCVCASCYASAAEMDMEEGRCPVCGTKNALPQKGSHGVSAEETTTLDGGGSGDVGSGHKRARDEGDLSHRVGWKREGAGESKDVLQRSLGLDEKLGDIHRRGGASPSNRDASGSPHESSAAVSKEVLQIEERLRHGLEKALAALDGPDTLSAAAKAKRVIGAELAALCEQ
ncbi:hypothetical protein ABB37_04443 [Leptomonas pyrrhocoris]|uniref:Uncharacterized protein n=1 Tax=Leptomonas pyrrhocoris TaxID=157538 RepID=A0A0M9G2L1_LEPPY|nr:hypothetical protein ABB37_04443 [Leptomonas pyrrhocoris]KPA81085.1 hypothetical protein ABB37_04443 [Leptomonas pyrrhocoris]|eukprot:XP_015659524.1 hypothetical protein ABB37_04443 [Leptomonas pyrrhocoris]